MRFSTIGFLALFFAAFGVMRHGAPHGRIHLDRSHSWPAYTTQVEDSRQSRAQRELIHRLGQELSHAKRQYSDTVRAIREIGHSVRSLQDLVRKSEREIRHGSSTAKQIRMRTLIRLKSDLVQIIQGRNELVMIKDELEAAQASLTAKIQLAEAGLLSPKPVIPASQGGKPERLSPIEALADYSTLLPAF